MRALVLAACAMAAAPLLAADDLIFADGFERGDFSLWSSASTGGGDLSVSPTAGMGSTAKGMSALVNDTGGLYVEDDLPANENELRARFYLDPHDFDPGESAGHFRTRVYVLFEEAPVRRLVALVLKRQGGAYGLMARARLDDNSFAQTQFFGLAAGPHAVEVHWRRSSTADANDGLLELWLDGAAVASLAGLDNNRSSADFARLGALSVKGGAAGTFYVDEYESRRTTYIGPCPGGACPLVCPIGYASCDGNDGNGCEVQNSGWSNTAPGEYLGSYAADTTTGSPFCTTHDCIPVPSRTGRQGRFFSITAREASTCLAGLEQTLQLDAPPGANYDLYVTGAPSCAPASCSSAGPGGDFLAATANETASADDTFTMNIEVRYQAGSSCGSWTLTVHSGDCLP